MNRLLIALSFGLCTNAVLFGDQVGAMAAFSSLIAGDAKAKPMLLAAYAQVDDQYKTACGRIVAGALGMSLQQVKNEAAQLGGGGEIVTPMYLGDQRLDKAGQLRALFTTTGDEVLDKDKKPGANWGWQALQEIGKRDSLEFAKRLATNINTYMA